MNSSLKIIILDRDGVINHDSDHYIKSPEEWQPIPGSLEAIARLTQAGYKIAVATNQAGVARGLFDTATLNAIHSKMHKAVTAAGGRIDSVFFCPHAATENCACRKPKAGMLLEIAARYDIDLTKVTMVGDALRDLQAAASVGTAPVLVKTGKGMLTLTGGGLPEGTQVFDDLAAYVQSLAL